MDTFYLFNTQIDNIYKFGMSSQGASRLKGYEGLNIPREVYLMISVENGFLEEQHRVQLC